MLQWPAKIHIRAGGGLNRKKRKQNASKLQVLEELQREAMEIAKEQHCRLQEARLNLTTLLAYEAETSGAENYGGARLKTTSRTKVISFAVDTLPQEAMVPEYSDHSRSRQE